VTSRSFECGTGLYFSSGDFGCSLRSRRHAGRPIGTSADSFHGLTAYPNGSTGYSEGSQNPLGTIWNCSASSLSADTGSPGGCPVLAGGRKPPIRGPCAGSIWKPVHPAGADPAGLTFRSWRGMPGLVWSCMNRQWKAQSASGRNPEHVAGVERTKA